MVSALGVCSHEIVSRIFTQRCMRRFVSSSKHDARSLSCYFAPSSRAMASAAVWEVGSFGKCAAESTASSAMTSGPNPNSSSNGFINSTTVDDRRESDVNRPPSSRIVVPTTALGGSNGMLLMISPQRKGLSIADNVADTSSLLSALEPDCECGISGSPESKGGDWSEGEGVVAKRLKIEEVVINSNTDESEIERRIARAWDHWGRLGEPKMLVAPMVDQSELPFRMLCRKYGATAAYTPMLHARLFAQDGKYRLKEFSTCPEDRPLFVQFCANDPDILLKAARLVEPYCDYVDINLGCPQRIAKKGYYGAFLMDNLPLVKSLVSKLASNLTVPVSCKIRLFPDLEDTLSYARMLEEAGCSLLAVHGRTRDQKDGRAVRADWEAIRAVKKALRIPVLGNGNIRWVEDVHSCIAYTGVDGVMSAESLLENPALFAGYRPAHCLEDADPAEAPGDVCSSGEPTMKQSPKIEERALMLEYLDLCLKYPVPMRMVRGHVHKILGNYWFKRNPDIRAELNKQHTLTVDWLKGMVFRLAARPPCLVLSQPGTAPTEGASDAVSPPLEGPVKPLSSGTQEELPILTSANVMSLS